MKSIYSNQVLVYLFLSIITQISYISPKHQLYNTYIPNKTESGNITILSIDIVQIGSSNNLSGVEKTFPQHSVYRNRDAVTYSTSNGGIHIPRDHPILTDLKVPRYVEGIHYFEDQPLKNSEVEAIDMNNLDDNYYKPFQNKRLLAIKTSNCEDISSAYVCGDTKFCMWDNSIKNCIFIKSYSFKQRRLR